MGDPKNASLNGDGFRFYRWVDAATGEETDVLSVTSIRKLCGEPFTLVNWQIANVIDVAMSTMKRTVIGPRGGVSEKRVKDEFPGEFARRLAATDGEQPKLDDLRKWMREQADEPRNIAAIRGSITHGAIEKNVAWDRIERPYVESAFQQLSQRDRQRAKKGVQDEDVQFVRSSMRQYWDMRVAVPFTIIAREVQVFNLEAGYAGSFDALVWMHGDFEIDPVLDAQPDEEGTWRFVPWDEAKRAQALAVKGRDITLDTIRKLGGTLVLLDWKTSKGVYTDQIVQLHAYLSAGFVGSDGIVDHRLTDLLQATMLGGIVHVRPNQWAVHVFPWKEHIARAFLGSVAFARFLASYPQPQALFKLDFEGVASEETE